MRIKNIIISILLIASIATGACFISSAAGVKAGDVDFDSFVTVEDALLALRATSGTTVLSADQIKAADVTYDGKVNSVDALRILLFVSGSISTLDKLSGDEGDDIII